MMLFNITNSQQYHSVCTQVINNENACDSSVANNVSMNKQVI